MVKQWEIESLWRTRAALIKAYLNRKMRDGKINNEKEIKMAYDPENRNEAYQCGALFAVLEKAQEDANRVNAKDTDDNSPLNATIGDRFFAAASKRPAAIFPRLLEQYKTAYVRKIRRDNISKSVYFDKMICELEAKLTPSGYPSNLKIDDQGRFTIGYYHKKAELYESKENKQKINEQPLNEQGE